ncbi:MAG: TIGR02281 family clan AA aspartic protease [Gammaproteobacteria bacterium]|nr:TIGR02281 family clan AA aspartic protease [Gammaproteobacteria bacterium]
MLSTPVLAVDDIRVMALFPGKAMVELDGKSRLLKIGKTSPEGVLLISADSSEAVIEIDGKRDSYRVGAKYGGSFNTGTRSEVRITRDNYGGYTTVGSINGQTVNMLLDTGATSVAMSSVEAKRLSLQYWLNGSKVMVGTASGYAKGYKIVLNRVQVGAISLRNVDAMVIEGGSPRQVLLGMSFLNRVEMTNSSNIMLLRSKL